MKIRVLYGCYYRGVRYEPGVYEVEREVGEGLLKTLHAVKHTPEKRAKRQEEEVENGS